MAELFVVKSKVKEELKDADMNMAGDFVDALSKEVEGIVKKAVARAKENKRKTVKAGDL